MNLLSNSPIEFRHAEVLNKICEGPPQLSYRKDVPTAFNKLKDIRF